MSKKRKALIFEDFQKWGWDQKGWSPRTRRKYEYEALAADRWLVENRNTTIVWATPKDLQAYLWTKPPHARTRNYVRQALMGFCAFLVARGYAEMNAALQLPKLPEPPQIPKALTVLQAERVLTAGELLGPMEYVMVMVMLFGGLRKTETQLLEWRHVDPDFEWLTVLGKGNKTRILPIHPKLRDALRMWRQRCESPQWIFPSTRNPQNCVSGSKIQDIIKEVGAMCGIPSLHPHVLRHTAATRLYEVSKGDLRTVQEYLGHADPKTTSIYTRIRPARLKEAVAELDFSQPREISREEEAKNEPAS